MPCLIGYDVLHGQHGEDAILASPALGAAAAGRSEAEAEGLAVDGPTAFERAVLQRGGVHQIADDQAVMHVARTVQEEAS